MTYDPKGLVEGGDGGEEALGVGVRGVSGDLLGRSLLDKLAVFEDGDLIADVFDDGQIVRDKKVGEV